MTFATHRRLCLLLPCLLVTLGGCTVTDGELVLEWPTTQSTEFAPGAHYSHERALQLLHQGRVPQARALIIDYLDAEPDDERARDLLRQIEADPEEWLGREHFTHVVEPGETLSGLAARYLERSDRFFVLARYNDITDPGTIDSGQRLRIPTRFLDADEPPTADTTHESTSAEPPPAEIAYREAMAALEGGDHAVAARKLDTALDHDGDHAAARDERERLREQVAPDLHREAVLLYRNQDLNAAIDLWDQVLILDPDYSRARDYRSRAVELRERLEDLDE